MRLIFTLPVGVADGPILVSTRVPRVARIVSAGTPGVGMSIYRPRLLLCRTGRGRRQTVFLWLPSDDVSAD